jgi:very-short-patch-repair endonuclease
MTKVFNRTDVKLKRQQLRNNMPDAEVLLWYKIRAKQLLGHKFRRQYSVDKYILDFYCPRLKFGIEIDGDSHFREGAKEYDAKRQVHIESFGIKIVRYLNTDIYDNLDGVLEVLAEEMLRREVELTQVD